MHSPNRGQENPDSMKFCGERYWPDPVLRQITRRIQESQKVEENLTALILQLETR